MQPLVHFIALITLFLFSNATYCQNPASPDEIQVLIDVSGSMKQNDPGNQRIEATQLLINLLPEGSKVSLWLFAEKTSLLSQTDSVSGEWRQQALKACQKIHSKGLRTHIEDAIQTTLKNGFQGSQRKHLILLTDGVVDTSADIMVSADSRERILSDLIPELKQQNINVETVALSEQADKPLLKQLAVDTNGWMESALNAEQLQRTFFKMAQKAAPKPTVPIAANNQFQVDEGIKEFSVLIFKKPKAPATELISPDQKKLNAKTFSTMMFWLEGSAYDLITVKQPTPGAWQINAQADPDNQVMILTDLNLNINELPNFIDAKQALPVKAHFTDHDKLITRDDFLKLVTVTLSIDHHADTALQPIHDETGYFDAHIADLAPGKHTLNIVADSKTFKREIIREIEVIASPLEVETEVDDEHRSVIIHFKPNDKVIDIASLSINASIKTGEQTTPKTITRENDSWQLKIEAVEKQSSTEVSFQISAKRTDGTPINPTAEAIIIDDSLFTEPEAKADSEHGDATVETEEAPEEVHWSLVSAVVLVFNGLFLGLGYWIYSLIQSSNRKQQQALLEKLA